MLESIHQPSLVPAGQYPTRHKINPFARPYPLMRRVKRLLSSLQYAYSPLLFLLQAALPEQTPPRHSGGDLSPPWSLSHKAVDGTWGWWRRGGILALAVHHAGDKGIGAGFGVEREMEGTAEVFGGGEAA
jgi:hypothetical protein